ncbi:MAG: hypothetical protein ACFFD1_16225 [Candidatus Thorarchaeota archaeon]
MNLCNFDIEPAGKPGRKIRERYQERKKFPALTVVNDQRSENKPYPSHVNFLGKTF